MHCFNAKQKPPYLVYPIAGAIFAVIIFVISLAVGQVNISFIDTIKALFGSAVSAIHGVAVLEIRFPRTAVACLVGIALSLSGLIYQSTFQNELVSPDILGVSSGASVGVAIGLLRGFHLFAVTGIGFVSGIGAMLLTLWIAQIFKNKSPIILVISGILVSGLMGSIVSLIKSWANTETILPSIVYWLLGSFASAKMRHVLILLPTVAICAVFLIIISGKILNNVALGQEEAKSKGVNYRKWKIIIIIIGTVLTASAVSVAGTIGWIGLVVPHITRLLVGHTAQKTIPVAVVFGGSFMMLTDILARTLTNSEIPVGAITGFIGIFVFILILVAQRGRNYVVD